MSPPPRIAAIIVTHHPELAALQALLASLAPQVEWLLLIDNASGDALADWLAAHAPANLTTRRLPENRGLAAAQNLGIDLARELGADHVLLSDQDSLPEPAMVSHLHAALSQARAAGRRVAAVGPRYFDAHQGQPRPFVRIRGCRVRRFDCGDTATVIEVDHLISSGSLIPLSVLDAIGPMTEELFIDYVDTEWCLRAWRGGYALLGVCAARMRHGLGERPTYRFGRYVPIHGPLRHYYLFRNAVWLLRHAGMPFGWKVATLRRLLLVFGYFSLYGPQRLAQIRMMIAGLGDGLRGRMGPYAQARNAPARTR